MKRAVLCFVCALLCAGISCNRSRRVQVQPTEEEPAGAQLVSTVHVADARSSQQLLKGWHDVEQNAWRWTEKRFSVLLRMPRSAAVSGATLHFRMAVPEAVTSKIGAVTLSAKIGGIPLAPETYSKPGEYSYTRDVPAQVLKTEFFEVDFSLDKSLPPGAVDSRELGIIAMMIGIEPK